MSIIVSIYRIDYCSSSVDTLLCIAVGVRSGLALAVRS